MVVSKTAILDRVTDHVLSAMCKLGESDSVGGNEFGLESMVLGVFSGFSLASSCESKSKSTAWFLIMVSYDGWFGQAHSRQAR